MKALDELETPWDKAVLLEDLKEQGLPMLEESIAKVVKTTFDWADKSMDLSGGYFTKFGKPALSMVRNFVLAQLDKVDGVVDDRK